MNSDVRVRLSREYVTRRRGRRQGKKRSGFFCSLSTKREREAKKKKKKNRDDITNYLLAQREIREIDTCIKRTA